MSYQGYLGGDRLVPEDPIRETGVLDVLPRDVVESLRAIARAHAVDLHDDEADLGKRLHLVERCERLRDERAVRPGVDVLDDRILPARIEIRWTVDHAVDVGDAVASLGGEGFRRLPAGARQLGNAAPLELRHERSVGPAMQLGYRSEIDAGVGVHVVRLVGRDRHDVVGVRLRERGEAAPVEVDAVVVDEVRILPRIHAAGAEPDLPLLFVHPQDISHGPRALRDLVLHRSRAAVVEIEVVPPVAL